MSPFLFGCKFMLVNLLIYSYYIQITITIDPFDFHIHERKTPLRSLCVKDSFDIGMKKSSRFSSGGCEM
ncbi:hypothetical protein GT50_09520 [Geobacillus stearothermophilus 10]|nr:hypothetical protein GT50_09520 [Geobacillus stearothermophilus 10]